VLLLLFLVTFFDASVSSRYSVPQYSPPNISDINLSKTDNNLTTRLQVAKYCFRFKKQIMIE